MERNLTPPVTWMEKGPLWWRGRGRAMAVIPYRLHLSSDSLIPLLARHMLVPDKGILE